MKFELSDMSLKETGAKSLTASRRKLVTVSGVHVELLAALLHYQRYLTRANMAAECSISP